jgi:hypothetical protein
MFHELWLSSKKLQVLIQKMCPSGVGAPLNLFKSSEGKPALTSNTLISRHAGLPPRGQLRTTVYQRRYAKNGRFLVLFNFCRTYSGQGVLSFRQL